MVINEWQDMLDLLSHKDAVFLASKLNVTIQGFANLNKVPKPLRGKIIHEIKRKIKIKHGIPIQKKLPDISILEHGLEQIDDNFEYSKYMYMKLIILAKIFHPADDDKVDEVFKKCFYKQDIEFSEEEKVDVIPKTPEITEAIEDEAIVESAEANESEKEGEVFEQITLKINSVTVEPVVEADVIEDVPRENDEKLEVKEEEAIKTESNVEIETEDDNEIPAITRSSKINKKIAKLEKENEDLKRKIENVSNDFKEKKKRISDLEKQVKEQNSVIKDKDKELEAVKQEKLALQEKINELMEMNIKFKEEIKYAKYPGVLVWVEEDDEYSGIKNIRRIVAIPSCEEDKMRIIDMIKKYNIKEIWYVKAGHSFGENRRMKELAKEYNIALIDKKLWEVK